MCSVSCAICLSNNSRHLQAAGVPNIYASSDATEDLTVYSPNSQMSSAKVRLIITCPLASVVDLGDIVPPPA